MCSSSTGALEGHSTHLHVGRSDLHLPLDPPAEGLQMAHSFEHIPVLRDEVVSLFASVPPGVVVDATVGGGGHAAALLAAYPGLRIVGLDRDPAALDAARERLVRLRGPGHARRSPLLRAGVGRLHVPGSGRWRASSSTWALAPLSSTGPERGFSFRQDGPLDMRMDPTSGPTAADLVNSLPEECPGGAVPGERRGAAVRAHRPGRRARPATDLHGAAGRSRGVGRAGAGPSEGPPGPPGVPSTAHCR